MRTAIIVNARLRTFGDISLNCRVYLPIRKSNRLSGIRFEKNEAGGLQEAGARLRTMSDLCNVVYHQIEGIYYSNDENEFASVTVCSR